MNRIATWLDNPIFVKHLRSRLRRGQVVPSGAVVFILCLLIAWWGVATGNFATGGTFAWYVGLQSFLLVIFAASQIATAVGGARESGIIDFHRVSPLSSTAVTLGFFFGAPIREYLLAAITLPFCLACAADEAPSLGLLIQAEVSLVLVAWLMQSFGLLATLSARKPKAGGRGLIGLLIFFLFLGGNAIQSFRFPGVAGQRPFFSLFGRDVPGIVFTACFLVPPIVFLLLASIRKMRSERAHALTKPEAVACLAIHAVLAVGFVWDMGGRPEMAIAVDYVLTLLAMVMAVTITPSRDEYAKGVRRADRDGPGRTSPWDTLAPNRLALGALCLIVLAGGEAAMRGIAAHPPDPAMPWVGPSRSFPTTLSTAVAVLTVAYFGLGWQAVKLAAPRRGSGVFGLFLFLAWGVPLAVGLIVAAAGSRDGFSQAIVALSPLAGIGMAAIPSNARGEGGIIVQAAAIGPPVAFAFLFNNLVSRLRRKVQVEVRGGFKPPEAASKSNGSDVPDGLTID